MYAALPIPRCKKIKTIYTYGEGGNLATRKEGGCTMNAASNAVMPKDPATYTYEAQTERISWRRTVERRLGRWNFGEILYCEKCSTINSKF